MNLNHYRAFVDIAGRITNDGQIRNNTYGIQLPENKNKTILKHLSEYGLIQVRTVVEHGWDGATGSTYYWVNLATKGEHVLQGKIEIEDVLKPCNCSVQYRWQKCKRHNK